MATTDVACDTNIHIAPDPTDAHIERVLAHHRPLAGVRIVDGSRPGEPAHLIGHRATDAHLRAHPVACELRSPAHRLDERLVAIGDVIVARRRAGGQVLWDGRIMRLDDDLDPRGLGDMTVGLREASYVAGLATNGLFGSAVRLPDGSLMRGADMAIGADGSLAPLAGSALANLIGVSTIGLLAGSPGCVIVVRQSARNASSGGLYAPSGSGSLEPADVIGGGSLQDIAARAMERELREECNLGVDVAVCTAVVSYGRWVQRAGKPEFFGVSVIDADAQMVRAMGVSGEEAEFVGGVEIHHVDLGALAGGRSVWGNLDAAVARRASVPLVCALAGLADALNDPHTADWLRDAGVWAERRPHL